MADRLVHQHEAPISLGDHHWYRPLARVGSKWTVAIELRHHRLALLGLNEDGERVWRYTDQQCSHIGTIQWEPHLVEPRPIYTLVSPDPLTIEPAINCPVCLDAGRIEKGTWVSARRLGDEDDVMFANENEYKAATTEEEEYDEEDEEEIEDDLEDFIKRESERDPEFAREFDLAERRAARKRHPTGREEETPENAASLRADILAEAASLVLGDRNASYGPPHQDFMRTADMLTAAFRHKLSPGERFHAHEVAEIMICIKLSRLQWSPNKRDNWTDIIGYGACGYEAYELTHDEL